jgi:hypothetical protein
MNKTKRFLIVVEVISKMGKIGQTQRMRVTYGTNR